LSSILIDSVNPAWLEEFSMLRYPNVPLDFNSSSGALTK